MFINRLVYHIDFLNEQGELLRSVHSDPTAAEKPAVFLIAAGPDFVWYCIKREDAEDEEQIETGCRYRVKLVPE